MFIFDSSPLDYKDEMDLVINISISYTDTEKTLNLRL